MDLILNNILYDYPNCKTILSRAGGILLYLIYGAASMLSSTPMSVSKRVGEGSQYLLL